MNSQAFPDQEQLTEEAVYWVSKLHGARRLSRRDKAAFSAWLNTSHHHLRAFDEINATWSMLGCAQHLPAVKREIASLSKDKPACKFTVANGWQVACFTLLVAGATAGFYHLEQLGLKPVPPSSVAMMQQIYETAAGENRLIKLPDGSTINLNTRSKVLVQYYSHKRHITLLRGEAHFVVAPDEHRPFVVKLAQSQVKAVGTAFNIQKRAGVATVTITEGVVQVRGRESHTEGILVAARHKVKLIDNSIVAIEATSTRDETAWQHQQLVFRSEPIDAVIKELNRYLEKTVIIQDPTLKNLRLTGTFDLSNPEEILQALMTSYGLEESVEQGYRFINRQ